MADEAEKLAPKKRGRKPKLVPELVAAQLVACNGNLSAVARHFNVSRSAVQQLIAKRKSLQEILGDTRESRLDDAEDSLGQSVKLREGWAVCFILKTLGKSRGYIEKQEIDLNASMSRLVIEEEVVDGDGAEEGQAAQTPA